MNRLSGGVIGCFLEEVYKDALAHDLRKADLSVVRQRGVTVSYDSTAAGAYFVNCWLRTCFWPR